MGQVVTQSDDLPFLKMNFRNPVPAIQTSLSTPLKRGAKQMKMPIKDFSSGLYHSAVLT